MYRTQQGFGLRNSLITIAIIVVSLVFVISKLPKGYSDDVSTVGKGTNVALLLHDKNTMTSLDLMGLMDEVRDDYVNQVDFIVVNIDVATPKERVFVQQQQMGNAAILLFSPAGERLKVFMDIRNVGTFRKILNDTFQLKP